MEQQIVRLDTSAIAALRAAGGMRLGMKNRWQFVCKDKAGNIKWVDTIDNLVVNQGLDHILDVILSAGTQITSWSIGLMSATPTAAAGDTMASHAGWTEVVAFTEANRQAFTDGGVSGQSLDNSASPAVFTINVNGTGIGGAFLASSNTKSGTTGTLYAAGAFTAGDKSLDSGDTLTITLTATAATA